MTLVNSRGDEVPYQQFLSIKGAEEAEEQEGEDESEEGEKVNSDNTETAIK